MPAPAVAWSHNGASLLSPEALRGPWMEKTFRGTLHVSASSSDASQGDEIPRAWRRGPVPAVATRLSGSRHLQD